MPLTHQAARTIFTHSFHASITVITLALLGPTTWYATSILRALALCAWGLRCAFCGIAGALYMALWSLRCVPVSRLGCACGTVTVARAVRAEHRRAGELCAAVRRTSALPVRRTPVRRPSRVCRVRRPPVRDRWLAGHAVEHR